MKQKIKYFTVSAILIALSMLLVLRSQAQVFDDIEARPNMTLKYKINKKLTIASTYFMYIDKNITELDKSVMAGEIGYEITDGLEAGFEYRFGMGSKRNYHDLRYSITLSHDFSDRLKIKYRPMYNQEIPLPDKLTHIRQPAENYLRNKVKLSYELLKNLDIYLSTENYQEILDGEMGFYKQKSALGGEIKLNKRNALDIGFYVINKQNGKNVGRIDVNYTITLGRTGKKS